MNIPAIRDFVTQYIRENSGLEQNRDYLGMSQIGRCLRQQFDWFVNGKGVPSDRAHLNCLSGYMYERKVREILEGAGIAKPRAGVHLGGTPTALGGWPQMMPNAFTASGADQIELVAPFDDRHRGHVDGETADDDLLEIKSMDREGVERMRRAQPGGALPKPYFDQIQAYMRYGDYARCLVVVVERDAFNFFYLEVARDEAVGAEMEARAKRILAAIDMANGDGVSGASETSDPRFPRSNARASLPCECGRCR